MTSGVDSQQPRPAGPDLPTQNPTQNPTPNPTPNPTDLSALAPPSGPPVADGLASLAPPTGAPVALDTSPQEGVPAAPTLVRGPDGLVARPSYRQLVPLFRRIGIAVVGFGVIMVIREGLDGILIALVGGLIGLVALHLVWLPVLWRTRVVIGTDTVSSRSVFRTRRFARSDVGRVGMAPFGARGDRSSFLVLVVQDRSDRNVLRIGGFFWPLAVLEAVGMQLATGIEVSPEPVRAKALERAFPGSTRWFERHPFLSVLAGVGVIVLVGVVIGSLA
ncbi:hypothetical protein [Sanguibacter suaedae]|uniref:PH domain-containing protein n=1 Tax=Sanguibacter suaedae TaxID=2795737 RepID=A0A934MBZ7_9MICO|nr:hypothetical protein [Sanguibacter suaedae]MBI9115856.1 hypothetical protein [Sanguibacter suaedae]